MPATQAPTSRWRASPAVLARLLVGLVLFGTGEALLVASAAGNSPWTVLAQGTSLQTPLTVGTATVLISGLVLLGWIPLRERPGLGTVANAVVIGLAIDATLPLLPRPDDLPLQLLAALCAIGLVGLGSGLYLSVGLGPGPRDGLMTGLHRRTGRPLWQVRSAIEATALASGYLLGGTVGLGTVMFALLVGPAVQLGLRAVGARDRRRGDTPPAVRPPPA
jgi:uncharacterized protein